MGNFSIFIKTNEGRQNFLLSSPRQRLASETLRLLAHPLRLLALLLFALPL